MPKIFQRVKGGNYYVRKRVNGHDKWVSLETNLKREAERLAAVECYTPEQKDIPSVTLADLWRMYLETPSAKAMKPDSLSEKAQVIESFQIFSRCKNIYDITGYIAAEYLNHVANRASPATARRHKTNLNSTWKAVLYRLNPPLNPWAMSPPIPSVPGKQKQWRALSLQEVQALLQVLLQRQDNWHDMTIVALHTGLRLKNVVYLQAGDMANGVLTVMPFKTERKGKPVHIPAHPAILPIFNGKNGFLWPSEVKRYKANRMRLSQEFSGILTNAGIVSEGRSLVGFHSLRATFITEMERNGVSRSMIQSIVGHGSPLLTAGYSEAVPEYDAIAKLDYICSKPVAINNHQNVVNYSI